METTSARMRQLQATDAEWLAADPTLLDGEIAFSSDLKRYKVGPGQWSTLTYWGGTDAPSDGRLYGVKSGQWVTAPEYASIYTGNLSTLTTGSSGVKFFRLVPPVTGAWPSGGVNGDFLMMLEWDSTRAIQIGFGYSATDATTHAMYQRVKRNGVWGVWYTNVGYSPTPYVDDLNALSNQGTFAIQLPVGNAVVNGWTGIGFGDIVQHTNIDATTAIQIGYAITNGQTQMWMRSKEAGVWGVWIENGSGMNITEADITDLNRVRWRNGWQSAVEYVKNDMVVSEGYLAVANTTTTDSPVPVSSGDPIYGLPIAPTWGVFNFNGTVDSGQEYIVPPGALFDVSKYRFWVQPGTVVADYHYVLYYANITDPDNPTKILVASFNGSELQEGWNEYANIYHPILTGGTKFGVYLHIVNSASSTVWDAPYTRQGSSNNTPPTTGGFLTNNTGTMIRFSTTDGNSANQYANLSSVIPGTELDVALTSNPNGIFQRYRITATTDNGTWFEFEVVGVESGPNGTPSVGAACTATFDVPIPATVEYVSIADYYLSRPNVQGVLKLGDGTPTLNEAAYGVDIQVQELTVSADWDIAAITSGGGLSGGGTTPGGGASVSVGDTAPADPAPGNLWYKTSAPVGLYVFTDDGDSTQWVQTNGANITGDYVPRDGSLAMTGNLTAPEAISDGHVPTWGQVKAYVELPVVLAEIAALRAEIQELKNGG